MLKLNDNEYLFDENDINLIDILENGNRIEVIEVIGNNITNLGKLSNKEIYNFIKKEADNLVKDSSPSMHTQVIYESSTPTQDEIDDFCS